MERSVRIEQLTDVSSVESLAATARSEGFNFLDRLVDEWNDGSNRFDRPGEVMFGVFYGDELVATGGLTRQQEDLGRVRRVYVHPDHRRFGIATVLMDAILTLAREHYPVVILYTEPEPAKRLYEGMGFIPESPDGPDRATHRLRF